MVMAHAPAEHGGNATSRLRPTFIAVSKIQKVEVNQSRTKEELFRSVQVRYLWKSGSPSVTGRVFQ